MKFKNIIPICYWPSTVVFVDDDEKLLASAQNMFKAVSEVKTYLDPNLAVKETNENRQQNLLQDFISYQQDENNDLVTVVTEDISKLHLKSKDESRSDLVTVVVMDYNLPQEKGLFYIEQLHDPFLQTMLLTGKAEPQEVIDAFNSSIIDKYISKHDKDSSLSVNNNLQFLKTRYFEKLTFANLHPETKLFKNLTHPAFRDFFMKHIAKNKIKEFYLLDSEGSFLLIDDEGNKSIFAVNSVENLKGLELFLDGEESLSAETIEAINQQTKMPFFIGNAPQIDQWPTYIYDCNPIPDTDLVYSYIDDVSHYDV